MDANVKGGGWVIMLLLMVSCAAAQASINLSYRAVDQKTIVNGAVMFSQPYTGNLTLTIPLDAVALSVYADDQIQPMRLEEQSLSLSLENTSTLRWSYASKTFLDNNAFIANIVFPAAAQEAAVRVTLPEKAILAKPLTATSGSVFPRPTFLTTDGQAITIVWQKRAVSAGDELPVYVTYENQSPSILPYLALALVGLFMLGIVSYYVSRAIRRKHHQKNVHHTAQDQQGREAHAKPIETHLKQDEQQIIQILKQREGQCEQGTLRVITGFSKAKLSGLLSELEERRVVFREKRGKKNLVFLKEL